MKPFAFVFPGQGSQAVGMLDGWADHSAVTQTLIEASDALHQDIGALIQQGPGDALALTENTQPAMLVAGIAAYRVWMAEVGVVPQVLAGHSLGEYTALVASGALELSHALPLVRLRARAMQEAVPVGAGAMAAILGMDAQSVALGCAEVSKSFAAGSAEVVEAANFNDPAQTVISGTKAAVDKACEYLRQHGAKRALVLQVSAPFHSSLMRPAAQRLKEALTDVSIQIPRVPLINNIDVAIEESPSGIKDALYRQAFGAVRWVECVRAIQARGISHLVECGPGKVLAGLTKRIQSDMVGHALLDTSSLMAVRSALE